MKVKISDLSNYQAVLLGQLGTKWSEHVKQSIVFQ